MKSFYDTHICVYLRVSVCMCVSECVCVSVCVCVCVCTVCVSFVYYSCINLVDIKLSGRDIGLFSVPKVL